MPDAGACAGASLLAASSDGACVDRTVVTGDESSHSSSAADVRFPKVAASTPHTVRSLTSGSHQLARDALQQHKGLLRAGVQQMDGGGGIVEPGASSDGVTHARFDASQLRLPDDFLQDVKGPPEDGARRQDSKFSSSPLAPLPLPVASVVPPPLIANSNLARFLHTELGSQIVLNQLCSGGHFLKHTAAPAGEGGDGAEGNGARTPNMMLGLEPEATVPSLPPAHSTSPHWRTVWLSSDLRTVYWGEMTYSRTRCAASGSLPVDQIIVIFTGHQTRTFTDRYGVSAGDSEHPAHLLPGARMCAPTHCFSLITPTQTLDLEAISGPERDLWLLAFQWLLDHTRVRPQGTKESVYPPLTTTTTAAAVTPLLSSRKLSPPQSHRPEPVDAGSVQTIAPSDVPSNLSFVSALEILSNLVALGPTHEAFSYFIPPRPASPPCQMVSSASLPPSGQSSQHTSASSTPQQGYGRIGGGGGGVVRGGYASSTSGVSSAQSSLASTPSFGSPALMPRSIGSTTTSSVVSMSPLMAADGAPPPLPPSQHASLAHTQQTLLHASLSGTASLSLPPAALPVAIARQLQPQRSVANLAPLPEADEDTAGSTTARRAHSVTEEGVTVAAAQKSQAAEVSELPLPALVPSTAEPALLPSAARMPSQSPPDIVVPAVQATQTSLHAVLTSIQGRSHAIAHDAAGSAPLHTASSHAHAHGDLLPPSLRPPSPSPLLDPEALRLERLLDRESRDHSHLRQWVGYRFLHLQSHVNSLCIERAKLHRKHAEQRLEEETEVERELERVRGATPQVKPRRISIPRCQSADLP